MSAAAPPSSDESSTGMRCAIGLDVGGTKIAGAVVTDRGHVLDTLSAPTPKLDQDTVVAVMLDLVDQLRRRQPAAEAVGVGAAGMVEWPGGLIRWAPNNAYRNLPLRDLLHEATGLPTVVDNDANTAAWAEACLGQGGPFNDMVFLTVGTGVGGGLVLDGQLYRGRTGVAAELGHMIVDPQGPKCGCENRGCLEALASGTALERIGREAVANHPTSYLATRAANDPSKLTGRMIFDAARGGDTLARSLFEQIGYWLGVGIASLLNIFELQAVIIGGGLAETGELLLGPARTSMDKFTFAKQRRATPTISSGTFGGNAGMIGAAHLALTGAK